MNHLYASFKQQDDDASIRALFYAVKELALCVLGFVFRRKTDLHEKVLMVVLFKTMRRDASSKHVRRNPFGPRTNTFLPEQSRKSVHCFKFLIMFLARLPGRIAIQTAVVYCIV